MSSQKNAIREDVTMVFKLRSRTQGKRLAGTRQHSNLPRAFCLFVVLLFLPATGFAREGVNCALVKDATTIASAIRGLRALRPVRCEVRDRKQVEQYLIDTIQTKIPQDRMQHEAVLYRMLGIIPKEFAYVEGIVKLYTSQLGGYYEPVDEYYAMAEWMPAPLQLSIAVHELTHALQDQHYNLDTMMDHRSQESDLLAARSALVEGDASAVMIDFSRQQMGQRPLAEESSVAAILMQNIAGSMISSSLHDAPPALQGMLIFPYVSGLRFAHSLLKEGGYQAIDRAYRKLPESTEHILHPEVYLRGERGFIDVPIPTVPEGIRVASSKPVFVDRLGEFFVSTVLGLQLPPQQASAAATGWGGDRIALYSLQGSERFLLVWTLHWDSEAEAEEFFVALQQWYAKRLGVDYRQQASSARFIDPSFGPVEIVLSSRFVRLRIGE